MQQKRIGSHRGPPRIVALVPLNSVVDVSVVAAAIGAGLPQQCIAESGSVQSLQWMVGGRAKRVLLYATPRDQHALLDIAKVADVVCFIASPPPASSSSAPTPISACSAASDAETTLSSDASPHLFVDDFGRHALTILKAQGLPSSIGLLWAPEASLTMKTAALFRKTAARFFHTAIGEECRVVGMDAGGDAVRRFLAEGKLRSIGWRADRAYALGVAAAYDAERRELRVTGWLRGQRPLSVNGLVHIVGHGDYQMAAIADTAGSVLALSPSPEARESLTSLNPVDPLAHEQSIITDEELTDAHSHDDPMGDEAHPTEPYDDDPPPSPTPSVTKRPTSPAAPITSARGTRRWVCRTTTTAAGTRTRRWRRRWWRRRSWRGTRWSSPTRSATRSTRRARRALHGTAG